MSEAAINEFSEFIDLMKKVHGLELQVQSIARDHGEVMGKCNKMVQSIQDNLSSSLGKQNKLVQDTNNSLANQVNTALSTIRSTMEGEVNRIKNFNPQDVYSGFVKETNRKIENIENRNKKMIALFTMFSKFLKEHEEKPEPPKIIEIADLSLTMRSINCLKAEGITTLNKLSEMFERDVMRIPNFGKKSLREIKAVLEQHGLNLRYQ